MKTYVGMDNASIGGVAFYNPTLHLALVAEVRGNPIYQLSQINVLMGMSIKTLKANDILFVFEMLVHFRNANTVRSLAERSGFLKYSLQGSGFKTVDVDPNVVRKSLGTKDKDGTFEFFAKFYKGKFLTNNHTDAVAVAVYQAKMDGYDPNFEKLSIERIEV